MREPSIHDYPWLLDELGLRLGELGAVMLPVRFRAQLIEEGYRRGSIFPSDLHVSENADRFWIAGDVTANAHVTLLYGLLDPINDPDKHVESRSRVERLLETWRRPGWLPIKGFTAWPSTFEDEEYAVIVAELDDPSGALAEARARLQYLPHVLTFPNWKLHATVAYVRPDAADRWLDWLTRGPRTLEVPSGAPLNLGETRPSRTADPVAAE